MPVSVAVTILANEILHCSIFPSHAAWAVGKLALAITLAGLYVAATPRLRSDIRLYLLEYRERRKQLLSMKARN